MKVADSNTPTIRNVGPFSHEQIKLVAMDSYQGTNPVKNWHSLTEIQRGEQVQNVVGILTGDDSGPVDASLGIPTDSPFFTLALKGLRNLPGFDEDRRIAGNYVINSVQTDTKPTSDTVSSSR